MSFILPNQAIVKEEMSKLELNTMTTMRDILHDLVVEAKDLGLMSQMQAQSGDTRGMEIIESEKIEELVSQYMSQIKERIFG